MQRCSFLRLPKSLFTPLLLSGVFFQKQIYSPWFFFFFVPRPPEVNKLASLPTTHRYCPSTCHNLLSQSLLDPFLSAKLNIHFADIMNSSPDTSPRPHQQGFSAFSLFPNKIPPYLVLFLLASRNLFHFWEFSSPPLCLFARIQVLKRFAPG